MIWPFQLIYVSKTLALPISMVTSIVTISSLTALGASPIGGAFADRFGRRNLMIFAQVSHGIAYVLMSLAHTWVQFLVPMTLIGAAMPLYSVGSDAMMADMVPSEKRSSAYSILRMFNNTGIAIGPAIGGLIVSHSYQLGFILAGFAMSVYGLYLFLFTKETLDTTNKPIGTAGSSSQGGYGSVLANQKYLVFLLAITIGIMAPMMLWMLLAIYTTKYFGISESQYSLIPMTNAIMCVTLQFPVTLWIRKLEARQAITLGMFAYAIGVGSVAIMTGFWGFWLSMVIMTFGELILVPTATKYIADMAPVDLRGRYMSLYWLSWGISRAVAPMVGGLLHDKIGPSSIWWGGLALGLSSTFGLFVISKLRSFQVEHQAVA